MNISESSIRPFEPHGMPTLTLIILDPDGLQLIHDNLEMTYKLITDLELDDGTEWARETLEGCALEAGATRANAREQPLKNTVRLGYMVYFHLKDGPYERLHMKLLHPKP